jgi:hypothetical protein
MSLILDGTAGLFGNVTGGNISGNFIGLSGSANNLTATATGSTTTRTLANRFADVVNVKDFGAVGDGVADDTSAFQSILNIISSSSQISCFIPNGTYLLNSSPIEGSTKITWIFDRSAILSGAGTLPFIPKKVQLGGTPISPEVPKISLIDGTPTNPLTNLTYKTPALYVERHTNGNNPDSCTWGNPKKTSAIMAEIVAYSNETGEVNCFSGRSFSNQPRNESNPNPLVGISALTESNVSSGKSRDVFTANFVAASQGTAGTEPNNIVGIETDIISNYAMPVIPPGVAGSINATAYWAQSAGPNNNNAAHFVSSVSSVTGWNYGAYFSGPFYDYAANYINSLNSPTAKGVRIQTTWGDITGRIFECFIGTQESFRVDGHSGFNYSSPVWLRVEGSLKNIEVGAADSGGVGYRMLRVVN